MGSIHSQTDSRLQGRRLSDRKEGWSVAKTWLQEEKDQEFRRASEYSDSRAERELNGRLV